jgi:hypothetical protein
MHHYVEEGKNHIANNSSVSLSFQYTRSGNTFTVQVERQWIRQSRRVDEVLTVLQDGCQPEVSYEDNLLDQITSAEVPVEEEVETYGI